MRPRQQEGLGQILDLRHALHAAGAARIHRLDDKIAAAFDGDTLQFLRRGDFRKPRHGDTRRLETFLHRQLVASQFRHMDGKARQAQALRHGGGGYRRIGGDADHAVYFANLAAVALGGGGGFGRAINIGDQAGIGEGKARRFGIAVGNDHGMAHFLGAAGGIRRLDAAGNDQKGFASRHQKYRPPLTFSVWAVM